jgi:predicted ester cyclase
MCPGDVVATNKALKGKHVGELFGQPASDQQVAFRVIDFRRVPDEKSFEHWGIPARVTPASSST